MARVLSTPRRRALITGITGQDGSYLAPLLIGQGYEVHGLVRRPVEEVHTERDWLSDCRLHQANLLEQSSLKNLLAEVRPHELYNLAAPSFVPTSWQDPVGTADVIGLAVTGLLDAIRQVDLTIRFCQAGSSAMFGQVDCEPQNESTPFHPGSPYGAAKVYAHYATVNYRQQHGLFAANAILFNHESPRRAKEFVTRKITDAAAQIALGRQERLVLGDLGARRDWGFAGDYVRAMWLMLQQDEPDDYVIATGQTHTVRQVVELAFARVGLDWRPHVDFDESLVRGFESGVLRGDPSKARDKLGWQPSLTFEQLIATMVDADVDRVRNEMQETQP